MKKGIWLCSLLVLFLLRFDAFAQNEEHKWGVGVAADFPDFKALDGGSIFDPVTWNKGAKLSVTRYLFRHLNAGASLSLGSITNYGNLERNNQTFWDADITVNYPIIRSITGKDTTFFDPYLFVGAGMHKYAANTGMLATFGLGMNFWIKEDFAINVSGGYNAADKDFMQYNVGVNHIFGKIKDEDEDGIPDKEDACPAVAGPKYMMGCPDADGDTITDEQDECPELAGLKEFNGCPDSDGDGIPDKDDECPTVAGSEQFKGCPDTDGDGIPDKLDKCPQVTGMTKFDGCPDSDNDGIPDSEDKCPNEAGDGENGGCPKTEEQLKEEKALAMGAEFANTDPENHVRFASSSYKVRKDSYPTLDRLIENLKKNSKNTVKIYGHCDSTGGDRINVPLSKRRADAVKKYLVRKGVSSKRIMTKGFSSSKPIASNETEDGKAKNRRVEILLVVVEGK